jgi:hypothetical protein
MTHKNRKKEKSCFKVLDVLFCGLKASHVAWTLLWRPRDRYPNQMNTDPKHWHKLIALCTCLKFCISPMTSAVGLSRVASSVSVGLAALDAISRKRRCSLT